MLYPNVAGLILAGGKATRMGGNNKGLVKLNNKYMISYLIDLLRIQLSYLAISVNRDFDVYAKFNLPLFKDLDHYQNIGPLGGLISSIVNYPSNIDTILVVPCDTPFLPANLVTKLATKMATDVEAEIVYAQTASSMHPSIFLAKYSVLLQLGNYLKNAKSKSIKSWIFAHKHSEVYFDRDDDFININDFSTLDQYNNFKN